MAQNCTGNPSLTDSLAFPANADISGYVCGTAPLGEYSYSKLSACCATKTVTAASESEDISYPATCLTWCKVPSDDITDFKQCLGSGQDDARSTSQALPADVQCKWINASPGDASGSDHTSSTYATPTASSGTTSVVVVSTTLSTSAAVTVTSSSAASPLPPAVTTSSSAAPPPPTVTTSTTQLPIPTTSISDVPAVATTSQAASVAPTSSSSTFVSATGPITRLPTSQSRPSAATTSSTTTSGSSRTAQGKDLRASLLAFVIAFSYLTAF